MLYGFSIILFWGDLKQASGLDSGHWFWGTTLYLAVLLTVLGKAALISELVHCISPFNLSHATPVISLWTKYTVVCKSSLCSPENPADLDDSAIPGSFAITMVLLPIYALVAPLLNFSTEYAGIVPRLSGNWIPYLTLLLLPAIASAVTLHGSSACLPLVNHPAFRHINYFSYRRTYRPASYHIAQELQKYNIPDYRPRQEQYVLHVFLPSRTDTSPRFQNAIKKVRAMQ